MYLTNNNFLRFCNEAIMVNSKCACISAEKKVLLVINSYKFTIKDENLFWNKMAKKL